MKASANLASFFAALCFVGGLHAQVPQLIAYQGRSGHDHIYGGLIAPFCTLVDDTFSYTPARPLYLSVRP